MMKLIPPAVTLKVARQVLKARQNSPSLLFGAGVVGMNCSTILACRSTLRLEEVMTKTKTDLELAKTLEPDDPNDYTDEERKKDIAVIYIRGAGTMVKLYAPAVLLGAASIAALTKSHHILQERNLALTAAYATVAEAFERYRSKVVDKYGETADRDLFYETEKVTVVDEKGKKVTRTRINPDAMPSMYARFFDETSSEWSKESEYNYTFLRCQQCWFNDLLKMRGYVMLNQVYEALGLLPTSAGAVVGWVLDGKGDSFIDFGIFNEDMKGFHDFVNGRERSVLLDFNVDGIVHTKLDDLKEGFYPWQS